MKRWAIITFTVVVVIAIILGSTVQLIWSLNPVTQNQGLLPFIIATGITAVIANVIIAVMQWFGKSPLDFLPEKTPREEDPKRFRLTRSNDPELLEEQTDRAMKVQEYNWAILFAERWAEIQPGSTRALEDLGKALLRSNQPERAKNIGEKLIQLDRIAYDGYYLLGQACADLGELDNAEKWYEQALLYVPQDFRYFILRDVYEVFARLGKLDQAITALKECISLNTDESTNPYLKKQLNHLESVATRVNSQAQTASVNS